MALAVLVVVVVTPSDLPEGEVEGSHLGLPAVVVVSQESVQMSTSTTSPRLQNLLLYEGVVGPKSRE